MRHYEVFLDDICAAFSPLSNFLQNETESDDVSLLLKKISMFVSIYCHGNMHIKRRMTAPLLSLVLFSLFRRETPQIRAQIFTREKEDLFYHIMCCASLGPPIFTI